MLNKLGMYSAKKVIGGLVKDIDDRVKLLEECSDKLNEQIIQNNVKIQRLHEDSVGCKDYIGYAETYIKGLKSIFDIKVVK